MYGPRISLTVGIGVVAASATIGIVVGLWAGFQGGWFDEVLMPITEIFYAFPALIPAMAIAGAPDIPVAEPDVEVERDLGWVVVDDTGGDANVIIHNDDVTPMDFVVAVLRSVFGVGGIKAQGIMLTAHYRGQAYVCTLPRETAKDRVGRAHGLARQAGYPLTFSIEDSA